MLNHHQNIYLVLTLGGPLRIFASSLIRPLPNMGPNESATFCSTTPKFSPEMFSPLGPRLLGDLIWIVSLLVSF